MEKRRIPPLFLWKLPQLFPGIFKLQQTEPIYFNVCTKFTVFKKLPNFFEPVFSEIAKSHRYMRMETAQIIYLIEKPQLFLCKIFQSLMQIIKSIVF